MNTDASSSFMPSVLDAADRIRQGTLTPVQLVEQSLESIKTHNSTLNAFGDVYTESALEQARILTAEAQANQFRGPLHGIPFGIKDLFSTANLRTTRGSLTGHGQGHGVPLTHQGVKGQDNTKRLSRAGFC